VVMMVNSFCTGNVSRFGREEVEGMDSSCF
jgi:hypothetical protein